MIQENINLAGLNTLKLDADARYFCEVSCDDDLLDALEFARRRGKEIIVLGGGSNIVFTGDVDALVIHPAFRGIKIKGKTVAIGAGENWHELVRYCLDRDLSGIENLSLIPGCCGAAPVQNIGAYGQELSDVFVELQAVHRMTGEKLKMNREDCQFGYRESAFKNALKDQYIITEITLELASIFKPVTDYRGITDLLEGKGISSPTAIDVSAAVVSLRNKKLPDPAKQGNVGSFFKNPLVSTALLTSLKKNWPDIPSNQESDDRHKVHAAWLIENAGMKGAVVGDAMVSKQHALVIVNLGRASSSDVLGLRDLVQSRVEREFNIVLEVEPTFYPEE